jgi:hypothetical protein
LVPFISTFHPAERIVKIAGKSQGIAVIGNPNLAADDADDADELIKIQGFLISVIGVY